jgi:hypothetical protein
MAETTDEEVLVPQVETTTEETPVETTETTQEVVDEVEAESFEEDPDYKDFYTGPKATAEGDKVSISPEEYSSLKQAASELEQLKNNPTALAVLNHFTSGGTAEQLAARFDTRDYTKMSEVELYRLDLASVPGVTQEEIDDELERFEDMSAVQRKRLAADIRERLERTRNKGADELVSSVEKSKQQEQEVLANFNKEFEAEIEKWEKKGKYFGLNYDKQMAGKVRQFVKETNGLIFINSDGSLNARNFHTAVVALLDLPRLASAKLNEGVRKGVRNVVKEVHNAGDKSTSPGGSENPQSTKRIDDPYESWIRSQSGTKR